MPRSFILTMVLLCVVCVVSGQKADRSMKFFDRSEAGFAFGISSFKTDVVDGIQKNVKNNEIVISLQSINGLMFNNRIGLGIGIGAEKWQHGMFYPLFGHISYYLKPLPNSFFGDVSLGYGIGSRNKTAYFEAGNGGLMFSAGLGYSREVTKRIRFQFEAFYKYQAIKSAYNVYVSDTLRSQVDYKVPLSFIGFRIGILFK